MSAAGRQLPGWRWLPQFTGDIGGDMVEQVFADAGQVQRDRYAQLLQFLSVTDAGQHHQLRCVNATCAQNYFGIGPNFTVCGGGADDSLPFDDQPRRQGIGAYFEVVRQLCQRVQVTDRR